MSMRKTILLPLLALAPLAASAEITYYVATGVGGMKLSEKLDVSIGAFVDNGNGGLSPLLCQAGPNNVYGCTPGQPVQDSLGTFRGTDLGYRVFGGARFGQYFGVEVGYVNLGSPEDNLDLIIPPDPLPPAAPTRTETDVALKITDEFDGYEAYAVGYWPINDKWEAMAKIGAFMWNSTVKVKNAYGEQFPNTGTNALPTVLPLTFSVDTDGTDLAGGIGVNYKATDNMTLRAEGTWYDVDGTEQMWLLGGFVIYNF